MVGRDLFKTIKPLFCVLLLEIPLPSWTLYVHSFVLSSVDTVTNWPCHLFRAVSNAMQQYHIKGYSDIDNSLSLLYDVRKYTSGMTKLCKANVGSGAKYSLSIFAWETTHVCWSFVPLPEAAKHHSNCMQHTCWWTDQNYQPLSLSNKHWQRFWKEV